MYTTGLYIYIYVPQSQNFLFSNSLLCTVRKLVAVGFESGLGRGREGLRAVGMGTWRKPQPICFLLQQRCKLGLVFPDASYSYRS
jgi:hypothetical protein